MNIIIDRAELANAARRMAAIAPSNSPLDVLRGVLLETDTATGKLTLTATNMEISLEEKLPCTAGEDDSIVVDARLFSDMLEKLPDDLVELTRPNGQGTATLKSGRACYTVPIWPSSSFPKPELPFPADTIKVSGLSGMARRTVFATSTDNDKPLMKCVNLMFTPQGLRAAGSDGSCIVTALGDEQSVGNTELLVPASSLEKLAGIIGKEDVFHVGTTGKHIVFFKENFLFSARIMEGSYINTTQLVTSIQNVFTVLTDISDLKGALNSVLCVGRDGKVSLNFEGSRIIFRCEGIDASATAPIEVIPMTGAPQGEYWYDAKKLSACMRALSGTVTLGIAQGGMLTLDARDAFYLQNAMRPSAPKKQNKPSTKAA